MLRIRGSLIISLVAPDALCRRTRIEIVLVTLVADDRLMGPRELKVRLVVVEGCRMPCSRGMA